MQFSTYHMYADDTIVYSCAPSLDMADKVNDNKNTHNVPQAVCLYRGQETPPLMRNSKK